MGRVHKKDLRTMKDGKRVALDTMSGIELLNAADQVFRSGKGDARYKDKVVGILADARATGGNLYITLSMRRVLMGFIRQVFDEEWARRQGNRLSAPALK